MHILDSTGVYERVSEIIIRAPFENLHDNVIIPEKGREMVL